MPQTYIQPKRKNFPYPRNIMPKHLPQRFPCPSKMNLLNLTYTPNSHNQSKFVQQCPKPHPTQSSTNDQHYPNLTKQLNNPKMPKQKRSTCPHINFHPNHITSKNSHKRKWQQTITMPHYKFPNQPRNQQFNQKKKNELTLKSLLGGCGAWVFGSWRSPSSSFHSMDGLYFFPWNVRNLGGPRGNVIEVGGWRIENGFQKMGFSKVLKNSKI